MSALSKFKDKLWGTIDENDAESHDSGAQKPAASQQQAAADATIEAELMRAIASANAPALAALADNLDTLNGIIVDEAARHDAAVRMTLKKWSREQLLADFETCDKIISRKIGEFECEMATQIAQNVTEKQRAAATAAEAIAHKKSEIAKIDQNIADLSAQANAHNASASAEKVKIDAVRAQFDATIASLTAKMKSKKDKILSIAKGA